MTEVIIGIVLFTSYLFNLYCFFYFLKKEEEEEAPVEITGLVTREAYKFYLVSKNAVLFLLGPIGSAYFIFKAYKGAKKSAV